MILHGNSHAKVNLSLLVYEKQENGFHRIETWMAKTSLADQIEMAIEPGDGKTRIQVEGFPELETLENLACRAARLYLETGNLSNVDISLRISKNIPIGGGLGGGSANAATVLRLLQKQYQLFEDADLMEMGARLGSDVPFLLAEAPFGIGIGRGERIIATPTLPSRPMVLISPGLSVSTPMAYQALGRSLTWDHQGDKATALWMGVQTWEDFFKIPNLYNDLEPVVMGLYPVLQEAREDLLKAGSSFVRMSGSGSTIFGLFDSDKEAARAQKALAGRWNRVLLARTES